MRNEPLKLSLKHYDKLLTVEVNRSDLAIEEVIELFADLLAAAGFNQSTIRERLNIE